MGPEDPFSRTGHRALGGVAKRMTCWSSMVVRHSTSRVLLSAGDRPSCVIEVDGGTETGDPALDVDEVPP